MIETIALRLIPNSLALACSLPFSPISDSARQQTARNFGRIGTNLSAFVDCLKASHNVLLGKSTFKLAYEENKPDPDALTASTEPTKWLYFIPGDIRILLKFSWKSIADNIGNLLGNAGFILAAPIHFILATFNSAVITCRAFSRIALSPIPMIMCPIQTALLGTRDDLKPSILPISDLVSAPKAPESLQKSV